MAELSRPIATSLPSLRRRWIPRRPIAGRSRRAGFGTRLLLAIVITLAVVGGGGYALMAHQLRRTQIADYARAQRADVRSLEALGHRPDPTTLGPAIAQLIASIGHREGVLEALLIDPRSIIVASTNAGGLTQRRDSDPTIIRALSDGRSYAGRELDAHRDPHDFAFVAPVALSGGRSALKVAYDDRALHANLADVRHTLLLVGLLALFGGTAVFYLVGGRMLLRSHRIALERATRDGLTDLPNHRAFQDELPRAVAAATRLREPLAVIVFDLDDFKFLNDRHGHPHGDAVLRRVAGLLTAGRVEDRAFRVGGDEFAMLLPHTDGAGARTIAARLGRALTAAEIVVSMGISDLRDGESAEDLRAEADAALYEAKRGAGHVAHFDEIRDRVTITTSA
ncbi:MAG TPA: GGDEF domain-containing protein, partial [Baekduia sp.]